MATKRTTGLRNIIDVRFKRDKDMEGLRAIDFIFYTPANFVEKTTVTVFDITSKNLKLLGETLIAMSSEKRGRKRRKRYPSLSINEKF